MEGTATLSPRRSLLTLSDLLTQFSLKINNFLYSSLQSYLNISSESCPSHHPHEETASIWAGWYRGLWPCRGGYWRSSRPQYAGRHRGWSGRWQQPPGCQHKDRPQRKGHRRTDYQRPLTPSAPCSPARGAAADPVQRRCSPDGASEKRILSGRHAWKQDAW